MREHEDAKSAAAAQVEDFAKLQFSREEIELMLLLDDGQLASDPLLDAAYRRGALLGEAEVRKGIKAMAIEGKSQAGNAFLDLVDRRKAGDRAADRRRGKK